MNKHQTLSDNPAYQDSGTDLQAVDDVVKWCNKSDGCKGGKVLHSIGDVSGIRKICCNKMMGEKCGCEPNPTTKGHKERH